MTYAATEVPDISMINVHGDDFISRRAYAFDSDARIAANGWLRFNAENGAHERAGDGRGSTVNG